MAAFWTRRALQREGFTIIEENTASAGPLLHIEQQEAGWTWRLETGAESRHFTSIATLLEALNDPRLP